MRSMVEGAGAQGDRRETRPPLHRCSSGPLSGAGQDRRRSTMQVYEAPLRDMRFVIHELFGDDGFGDIPAHAEFTTDLIDAVIEEAAKLAQEVLLPINASGDLEGCLWEN